MKNNQNEIIYRPDILGEKISDLREQHGLKKPKDLAKALSEKYCNISFCTRQIKNYESGTYTAEIKAINLLALSKLFGVTTDYLLDNDPPDKDGNIKRLIENRLGINDKSIETLETLKRKKVKSVDLISKKLKYVETTNELEVVNHFLSNTNFWEVFKEQANKVIEETNKLQEVDVHNKNELKEHKEELQNSIYLANVKLSIELDKLFKKYIENKCENK